MLDKNLIKNNFKKALYTYEEFAIIQKEMAKKLVSFIDEKSFNSILEIGSYSGILTKAAVKNFEFRKYLALDIINKSEVVKNIDNRIEFIKADIEEFETDEKFDLIISNATLQWCEDFSKVIEKLKSMLNDDGVLAISIFGKKNLYEIKDIFNVSLNYPDDKELDKLFSQNATIIQETKTLEFDNPKDILKHLKYTGVNSINKNTLTYKEIKEKLAQLSQKYENKITYNPLYIIDLYNQKL